MTPNTTPAPRWMPADPEAQFFPYSTGRFVLATDYEAERTRADALAARLETAEAKWSEAEQACAFATGAAKANHENAVSEAKAHGETLQKMQQLAAHIAELEAGIGRIDAITTEMERWSEHGSCCCHGEVNDRAEKLRAELRSLIGHKEGNGDG